MKIIYKCSSQKNCANETCQISCAVQFKSPDMPKVELLIFADTRQQTLFRENFSKRSEPILSVVGLNQPTHTWELGWYCDEGGYWEVGG